MVRLARSLALLSLLVALFVAPAHAQDRAQQILGQARAALGDQATIGGVTGLSAVAKVRRVIKMVNREMPSEVHLDLLLPDKYRRTEVIDTGVMTLEVTVAASGDKLLYEDGGMAKMSGVDPAANETQRRETLKGLRQDLFRLFTLWLLSPPSSVPSTLTYKGLAEAPDGKADVLEMKAGDDFVLQLFLDTGTHRLLMATQQTKTPDPERMKALNDEMMAKVKAGGVDQKQLAQQMRDEMAKLPKKDVTIEMHFGDYKPVHGVLLPHHMTTDVPGQVEEEWTVSSFTLNPAFKPDRFEKK